MMEDGIRLPEGIVTAPLVRHPKQFLSEAWLRSLMYFRSSQRIGQTPPKQQQDQQVTATSHLMSNKPRMSQQSSYLAIQQQQQQQPTINVQLDCPVVMGYLLKYSELEHNCEVSHWFAHCF